MMQQWQQMTSQQKAMAIGLMVVIVLALVVILWILFGGQQPQGPAPTTPSAGVPTGATPTGMVPGSPPGAAPSVPSEMAAMPRATVPTTQPAPPPAAPSAPQVGKMRVPPKPGRGDPFAALPPRPRLVRLAPFVPPRLSLPHAEEPITEPLVARETPAERIASLPISSVAPSDFTSYLSTRPQGTPSVDASGWRMAGFLMTEQRVTALLQLPDGKTRSVQPGSTIVFTDKTYTVTRVESDRVVLRSEQGDELVVTRRPAQVVPTTPFSGSYSPSGEMPY